MSFENFEQKSLEHNTESAFQKLDSLHTAFEGSVESAGKFFGGFDVSTMKNVALWLNIENMQFNPEIHKDVMSLTKQMLEGGKDSNGHKTLGLREISSRKTHPDYQYSNLKQQAGFSAEVVSTAKENMISRIFGFGKTTYRADDLPDQYGKNNQLIDKVRISPTGKVETVQTKFVGKSSEECWKLIKSKKYEKYVTSSEVDKIEIPKDYYDDIKNKFAKNEIEKVRQQVDYLNKQGNVEEAGKAAAHLEKLETLDKKLEKSNTTNAEALEAREHPEAYTRKLYVRDALTESHEKGIENAAVAAGITFTISTVDNVQKYMNGEITAKEAFVDVAKDTGKAGAIGYGAAFITTSVTAVMSQSSTAFHK